MQKRTILSQKINGIHSITLNNFNPKTGILTFDVTDFLDRSLEPNGQYKCEVLDYQAYYQVFDNARHLVNKIPKRVNLHIVPLTIPRTPSGGIITKDFIAYCVGIEPEAKEVLSAKWRLMEAQGLIKPPNPNKPNHLKDLLRIREHIQSGQELVCFQHAYLEDELNKNTCLAWNDRTACVANPRVRRVPIIA